MAKSNNLVEVTVQIPQGTYGRLLIASEEEDIGVDELITEAVDNYLNTEEESNDDNPE